jgi:hypothetical protein
MNVLNEILRFVFPIRMKPGKLEYSFSKEIHYQGFSFTLFAEPIIYYNNSGKHLSFSVGYRSVSMDNSDYTNSVLIEDIEARLQEFQEKAAVYIESLILLETNKKRAAKLFGELKKRQVI